MLCLQIALTQRKCYTPLYRWLGNASLLSTTGKAVVRAQRVNNLFCNVDDNILLGKY